MTVNTALMQARTRAGLSQPALARRVRETGAKLGYPNGCTKASISRWEAHGTVPQAHYLVILEEVLGQPAASLGFNAASLGFNGEMTGPQTFTASMLTGLWVTTYAFNHDGVPHHHADIATVTVMPDGEVRAFNGPARTEGRAVAFTNEIAARLVTAVVDRYRGTSSA
jgi:transcriptional regulator with XRE-family HTH domain